MPPARITSRQHDVVRRVRRAVSGEEDDVVLLDGEHLVAEALDAGLVVELVLTDGRASAVAAGARAAGAAVYDVTASVLEAASPVRTPSGIVALARWRTVPVASAMAGLAPLVVGLCGVQDPGNVGSVVRAADALGATGVLALDDSADPGGWKALRGAMGSTFHLPIARARVEEAVEEAHRRRVRVAATVAAGGSAPARVNLRAPVLVLLGSEGAGLPDDVLAAADERITIPMSPRANSLNVAAAAAVILYEASRQRAGAP